MPANSVARAFDDLYYFERACETYITALSTGLPLNVVSNEVARDSAENGDDQTTLWEAAHKAGHERDDDRDDLNDFSWSHEFPLVLLVIRFVVVLTTLAVAADSITGIDQSLHFT